MCCFCSYVRKGNTALHEAVLLGPDGQEAIETLLEAGASAKAKNAKGETPYDLAVNNGYESVLSLFASSMGKDMLDNMSDSKKEKGSRRREREEKEAAAPEVDRKYKEKRPKVKLILQKLYIHFRIVTITIILNKLNKKI